MLDAFTRVIAQADNRGEFLSNTQLDALGNMVRDGNKRLDAVSRITSNASSIVANATRNLFEDQPYLVQPGGSAYTNRRAAACSRDMEMILRYITYATLAGDASILDDRCLRGLAETYVALGIPGSSVALGIQKMKEAALPIINDPINITPGDCSFITSEVATYFDRAAAAVSGSSLSGGRFTGGVPALTLRTGIPLVGGFRYSIQPSPLPNDTPQQHVSTQPLTPSNDNLKRHVNVCVARQHEQECLPRTTSLGVNKDYALRIHIGPLSPDSVVMNPAEFPTHILPESEEGHWIEVNVQSYDFVVPKPSNYLFLPKQGASWVCQCPQGRSHQCNQTTRNPYLLISIKTPDVQQDAKLQIRLFYQNHLIQSQCLTAEIVRMESEGNGHRALIDCNVSALDNLDILQPRTVNVSTEGGDHGTHKIWIKGGEEGTLVCRLAEGQMRDAANAVRQVLYDIHILTDESGDRKNRLREDNSKTKQDFIDDLKLLAPLGQKFWNMLFISGRDAWEEKLKSPASIQISRIGGSNFVFPWNLVYDLPLESNHAKYQECRLLKDWETSNALLEAAPNRCPYDAEHTLNTICPFGFWGFKHVVEQLPFVPIGWSLPLIIQLAHRFPTVIVGRSLTLDASVTEVHLKHLAPVIDCDSLDDLSDALAKSIEIVYFYTHGRRQEIPGVSQKTPALQLGTDEQLIPDDIIAWHRSKWSKDHWHNTSPMVFINGCHTAELTPESLINFVDTFSAVHAAGVIGTEITLSQRLASESAEQFFKHFRKNETVGESLRKMRIHLLKKCNLLGLAYTAYCSTDLRLSKVGI